MSNPWLRLYHEWDSDPKVQSMTEVMQRRLIMLFCSKCKGGTMSEAERAFHWRISEVDLAATKDLFIAKRFIDQDWNPLKWDERQFISDSSAERVKKYRDKRASSGLPRGSSHLQDKALYERDCNRCIYCDSPQNLCIDHIFPISQGGSDHYDNLGVACKSCNSGKSGRTLSQSKYKINNADALTRYGHYLGVVWATEQDVTVTVTAQEQIRTEAEHIQKQRKTKAASGAKAPVFVLPAGIDRKAWDGYEEMRRKKRVGLTDTGRELCLKKLESLKRAGHDPAAVLNQSTMNGWQGLFEIKGAQSNGKRISNHELIEARRGFLQSRSAGRMADDAHNAGRHGETGEPGDGRSGPGIAADALHPHA